MTVTEFEDWLSEQRRSAPLRKVNEIDDYEIAPGKTSPTRGWVPLRLDHLRVDHVTKEVRLFIEGGEG